MTFTNYKVTNMLIWYTVYANKIGNCTPAVHIDIINMKTCLTVCNSLRYSQCEFFSTDCW